MDQCFSFRADDVSVWSSRLAEYRCMYKFLGICLRSTNIVAVEVRGRLRSGLAENTISGITIRIKYLYD